ncbi:ATP-binding protein [Rhizobium sp. NFR07]|uniref:ATP-binding protein n=1 Tax=Rhizobium sp. NFR07 TaxID=1566262 RepID=UPI00116039F7|nr:ATP-binding protein [Rhizobium sp. NFR07]
MTMLASAEPRGLPGTVIDRVAFQRGDEGFPLDDVIVHAHDRTTGAKVSLQIQVKRTISFTPTDAAFKKTAEQIARAIGATSFWDERNELAIATARASRKVHGAYQDVLRWARQMGSALEFFGRLNRTGAGNDDMRAFVRTLRDHLREAGADHGDETLWKVLGRLQILIFDFTAVGSASEELSRERASRVLAAEKADQASTLWTTLISITEEIAADGGDRDFERLSADLSPHGLAVAANARLKNVRAAIWESSSLALADIDYRIGDSTLARTERIEAVNSALQSGRYVEIRGEAGVGKSGILRQLAEQYSIEGRIIVLAPGRTPLRGWPQMRVELGFDGSLHELLSDLAADGGASLFLDNLDSFSEQERKTVNDLLRESSRIPGMTVIATARRNFGIDEQSWLDVDAIKVLDPATPVIIDELNSSEVEELSDAQHRLAFLLADNHPARKVVRNLYRLSRQIAQPQGLPIPTSELDMAEHWWRSADGPRNEGHRLRARVLRSLASMAIKGEFVLDASNLDASALDSLVRSETLRDLGNDRVAFRHDVLREWAIGNLLSADPHSFDELSLGKPATAVVGRGVELAARFALERGEFAGGWGKVLERLSNPDIHGSWRRAALLAIVHSEAATELLRREAGTLLENDAGLLHELIRTVMAVDVEPASSLFLQIGIKPEQIPPTLFLPNRASWLHLILWLIDLGASVPAKIIDDIAELYTSWMLATFGQDRLTPILLSCLHRWLVDIEDDDRQAERQMSYTGSFGFFDGQPVAEKLRTGLLLFASKSPDLAIDYLERIRKYKYDRGIIAGLLKFSGSLAQAAPKQLAELMAGSLIAVEPEDPFERSSQRLGPFTYLDSQFLPDGPTRGPFLELLRHSTPDGLGLVKRLVNHAIAFGSGGRDPGTDGFVLILDGEERFFPWRNTYRWSRGDSGYYAMGSSLMALEMWAHERIDVGDDFEDILKTVLGPVGSPAAFLLIAVDLIISHWPKSKEIATSFLASPELVSWDRNRVARDSFDTRDLFGLRAMRSDPASLAAEAALKSRPSRRVPLESLYHDYTINGPESLRLNLVGNLQLAAQRLGAPEPTANFADPEFMVQHALNLLEPANWIEQELQAEGGSVTRGRQYISPEIEATHIARMNEGEASRIEHANLSALLTMAMDNSSGAPIDLPSRGIEWARKQSTITGETACDDDSDDEAFVNQEAIRAAALILLRDGSDELRQKHGAWAEELLTKALGAKDDAAHRVRGGLRFNPVATAFAGLAELYLRDPTTARVRLLLDIAARESPAGAHGLATVIGKLNVHDERLPRAILRCALNACIKPIKLWDDPDESEKQRADYATRQAAVVNTEIAWLKGENETEPQWPEFSTEDEARGNRRNRRRLTVGKAPTSAPKQRKFIRASTFVDDQAAALWMSTLQIVTDVSNIVWVRDLLSAYKDFSASLNGKGVDTDEELSRTAYEWNAQYYPLLAKSLGGLSISEVGALSLNDIISLPDEPFFDVMQVFLRAVDLVYFRSGELDDVAPEIRRQLTERLIGTRGWDRHVGRASGTVEVHLGPALATLLFNDYVLTQTSTYLRHEDLARFNRIIPQLQDFLARSPSFFTAIFTMNTLEAMPEASLLPLLVAGSRAWLTAYPDNVDLWIERKLGQRICAWLGEILTSSPNALASDQPVRDEVDNLLAFLVRAGVPEARQFEGILAGELPR